MKKKNFAIIFSACCSAVLIALCTVGVANKDDKLVEPYIPHQIGEEFAQSYETDDHATSDMASPVYNNKKFDEIANVNINKTHSQQDLLDLDNDNQDVCCSGNDSESFEYTDDRYTFILNENGEAIITHFKENFPGFYDIKIPDKLRVDTSYNALVVGIDNAAFKDCTKLHSVFLPSYLKSIGPESFMGCFNMVNVTFPDSLKSIGDYAFQNCKAITSVAFSSSLESIGNYAFQNCKNIGPIHIPSLVTSIGDYAFDSCPSISYVVCNATNPPTLGVYALDDTVLNIYVPDASLLAYQTKWGYDDIIKPYSEALDPSTAQEFVENGVNYLCGKSLFSESEFAIVTGRNEKISNLVISNQIKIDQVIYPVNVIKTHAFRNCNDIESVNIPNSIRRIGEGAFSGCTGVTELRLLKKYIYPNETSQLKSMTSIETLILDGVERIEENAFDNFSFVKNLTLSTETISSDITAPLKSMTGLQALVLTNKVKSVSDTAFDGFTSIKSLTLSTETITKEFTASIVKMNNLKTLIFADGVKSIGDSAFKDCISITTLSFPDTLTSIGASAFYGCSKITSLTLPKSITLIGSNAFEGCTSVLGLTIATTNVSTAFARELKYLTNLQNLVLSESVETVCEAAFENCYSLKSVYIGKLVKDISFGTFAGCISVSKITVDKDNTTFKVTDNVLYKSGKNPEIIFVMPTFHGKINIPDGTTTIPEKTFYNCYCTSVAFPESINRIDDCAFVGASSLKEMVFSGKKPNISDNAFWGLLFNLYCPADSLSNWDITDTTLGGALKIIYKPMINTKNVSIATIAPYNTEKEISFVDNTSKFIGVRQNMLAVNNETWQEYTFEVTDEGNAIITSFKESATDLYDLTIPNKLNGYTVVGIDEYAFEYCTKMHSVILPSSLKSIGSRSFRGCSNLIRAVFPGSLESIGDKAFHSCDCLLCVVSYASTPPALGDNVFEEAVSDIYVPDSSLEAYKKQWGLSDIIKPFSEALDPTTLEDIIENNVYYRCGKSLFSDEKFAIVCGPEQSISDLEIPDHVSGQDSYPVTVIKSYAFSGCSDIKSVAIPNSITVIGQSAFHECTGVTKLTLLSENITPNLTAQLKTMTQLPTLALAHENVTIENNALDDFDSVVNLTLSSSNITTNLTSKLHQLINLRNLALSDKVKTVGKAAFKNFYKLQSVSIGKLVNTISDEAFAGCVSANTIAVDEGNTSFKVFDHVLYKLSDLEPEIVFITPAFDGKINIMPGTASIPKKAFYSCHCMSVVFPAGVTNIEDYAFIGVSSLKEMIYLGDKPYISPNAFYGLQFELYCFVSQSTQWDIKETSLGGATEINYKPMVNPLDAEQLKTAVTDASPTNTNILISNHLELSDKELLRVEGTKNLIAVDGGNLEVTNTCFYVPSGAGLNLNGVTFSGHQSNATNTANSEVATTGLAPVPFTEDVLTASNDEFYKNAVIYNYGTTNVDNCSFTDNSVLYSTIFNSGTLNVGLNSSNPVTFSNCNSTYADANTWGGGALYNNGVANLYNCVFEDCNGRCGGAIHNVAKLKLEKSSFTGCTAVDGAAVYNTGAQSGATKYFGDLVLNDCTISGCTATQHGSAIVSRHDAKLMFDGICMISGNGTDDVYLDSRYSDSLNSTFTVGNTFNRLDSKVGITAKNPKAGITVCTSIGDTQWSTDLPPFVSRDAGLNIVKQDNTLVYAQEKCL